MPSGVDDQEARLPLHAESLELRRREIATGAVKVSTVTRDHDETINELLITEHVEIDRVPQRRFVDKSPGVREEEDGTTVIPVIEEVLVVERRLLLKEEVRIKRVRGTTPHRETVTLRAQDVVITRSPGTSSQIAETEKEPST